MLTQPQGHSAAGRITLMKNSNDANGNRTRDLPACSAVSQLTATQRIHLKFGPFGCSQSVPSPLLCSHLFLGVPGWQVPSSSCTSFLTFVKYINHFLTFCPRCLSQFYNRHLIYMFAACFGTGHQTTLRSSSRDHASSTITSTSTYPLTL
jgi:hypothetical protein